MMQLLNLPVALPIWALAELRTTRQELRAVLGEPHYVETDSLRTYGGEEDSWAIRLSSAQRLLVVLRVPYHEAVIYGDPPELSPLLTALNITPDDQRLYPYDAPFEQT